MSKVVTYFAARTDISRIRQRPVTFPSFGSCYSVKAPFKLEMSLYMEGKFGFIGLLKLCGRKEKRKFPRSIVKQRERTKKKG